MFSGDVITESRLETNVPLIWGLYVDVRLDGAWWYQGDINQFIIIYIYIYIYVYIYTEREREREREREGRAKKNS